MKEIVMIYFAIQAYGIETGKPYGEPIEIAIPDLKSSCLESKDEKSQQILNNNAALMKQTKLNLERLPSRYFPKNDRTLEWKVATPVSCLVKPLS